MLNLDALPNVMQFQAKMWAWDEVRYRRMMRQRDGEPCDYEWAWAEFNHIMRALLRKPRSGNKTMRERTKDEAAAFFQYGRGHKVIDPKLKSREFARLVADYAMEIGLPGAEDLDPTSGPMKAMAATILRSEAG